MIIDSVLTTLEVTMYFTICYLISCWIVGLLIGTYIAIKMCLFSKEATSTNGPNQPNFNPPAATAELPNLNPIKVIE